MLCVHRYDGRHGCTSACGRLHGRVLQGAVRQCVCVCVCVCAHAGPGACQRGRLPVLGTAAQFSPDSRGLRPVETLGFWRAVFSKKPSLANYIPSDLHVLALWGQHNQDTRISPRLSDGRRLPGPRLARRPPPPRARGAHAVQTGGLREALGAFTHPSFYSLGLLY